MMLKPSIDTLLDKVPSNIHSSSWKQNDNHELEAGATPTQNWKSENLHFVPWKGWIWEYLTIHRSEETKLFVVVSKKKDDWGEERRKENQKSKSRRKKKVKKNLGWDSILFFYCKITQSIETI